MRSLALLLVITGTATAAPGDELSITFHDHALFVRAKDGHEAKLNPADSLDRYKLDAANQTVAIEYESYACQLASKTTYTVPFLRAKLENTPAFALHRKKQWRAALAGFQRAIAEDRTWPIPAYNAASAQQLLGDKEGAIATLSPWLTSAPVRTYVQVHQDPELAPLADHAAVRSIEATTPGNVEVTQRGITGGAAFSATHGLVAVVRQENGWGASFFTRDVELRDRTGALVATLPLVEWDETSPDCYKDDPASCELASKAATTKVRDRAASVQQLLRALGFSTARTEAAPGGWNEAGTKQLARFPKHKLGLVAQDGTLRVLRGNTVLATDGLAGAKLDDALVVEDADAIVVWSHSAGAEGCMSTDPSAVQLVPVKI